MAKRRREAETTASDVTAATYSTVFIDTSLDTHLAMIISYSDTVSDLKRKVMFEHLQCFPKLGEIKIHALKVKRKGNFYHLSDSMLVSSAFEAGKRNWFVSIDASSLKQQNDNQNSCRSEASNPLALVCFQQNPSGESSLQRLVSTRCTTQKLPDAEHSSPKESKDVDIEVKDITGDDVADKRSDIKVQEKYEVISDQCNNSMEQFLETKRAVKIKRKIKKKNNDSVRDRSLKDQFASNQMSVPEIVGPTNTLVGAGREVLNDVEMGSKDVVNEEDSLSRPAAKKKREIESTECSGNPSEIGTGEKKIKRRRKNAKYEPLVQHVEEERSFNENVEINHEDFGNENQSELVQEVVERNNVTSPSIGTDMREIDAINAKGNSDAPELTAGLNESSKRKKRKVKKVAKRNQDLPGMEQANDVVGDTALPVVRSGIDDHFNDETNKHKSVLSHPESKQVSEQKPIDDSSTGAGREVDNMIESEAQRLPQGNIDVKNKEPVVSAKLLEAEGAVDSVKVGGTKKKEKKVKKSAARNHDMSNLLTGGISETALNLAINGHSSDLKNKDESFLSRIEREEASSQQKSIDSSLVVSDRELDNMSGNEMDSPPLTQVNRSKENADDVDEKSGKKLKKGRISTTPKPLSDFPNKEQEHVVESVPQNEVEKNQEAVNMDSRLKSKTKKNQKSTAKIRSDLPINELGVDELTASDNKLRDRDPQSKTAEEPKPKAKIDKHEQMEASNEGDEINFKHYFVPGREEKESAPVDKLKEATRPDREMKSKKNKKKPVVSSIGTSPELQNKEKSKDEDSDLMPPPKKSLEVSGSAVKTRTDASFNGNHKRQTGVDTYNAAVRKGSAKNTGEVEEATSEAKNGSQQEKSLLATPCAIFSDDSSDSSPDEKRSVDSDASTRTPSHNSSSSGSSMDSPTNGSYGTERKEGGKNITKSQSAGPKNITMDMIFRSSSRFKKAKLTALGDSESQPVDFVPDSQANV